MKVKLENPNFTQDYLRNLLAARGVENFVSLSALKVS